MSTTTMKTEEFEEKLMEFEKDALTSYLAIIVPGPNYAGCLKNISSIQEILSTSIDTKKGIPEELFCDNGKPFDEHKTTAGSVAAEPAGQNDESTQKG